MKYLMQGQESIKKVEILLSATKIEREQLVSAIYDHLCKGLSKALAADLNDIKAQNLGVAIDALNEVAAKFEAYFDLRYNELTGDK